MQRVKTQNIRLKFILALCVLFSFQSVFAAEKKVDTNDVSAMLAQELKLDDKQTQQMRTEMQKYGAQLEKLFDEQEVEDADPQKLISGIKQAQDAHNKELQNILSKDQFKSYELLKEKTIKGIFTDLVAIQLLEIKPKTSLSNEQIDKLSPILADAKYNIIKIVWANVGKQLRPRQKISIARQLKSIQSDTREGIEKILSPDQLKAWDKYKAEQQQKKK